jgi:hypothetical protein
MEAAMAEADADYIELNEALLNQFAGPSEQEVAENAERLEERYLKDYESAFAAYREIHKVEESDLRLIPEARFAWMKRQLTIEQYDGVLCSDDPVAELWPPPDLAIKGAQRHPLLTSQFRACPLERRRQMIIAGRILAPDDRDELNPFNRWHIMLRRKALAARREQQAQKRTAASVSEEPAVHETPDNDFVVLGARCQDPRSQFGGDALTPAVGSEPTQMQSLDLNEQRSDSIPFDPAHPGDNAAEARIRRFLKNLMTQDPKNNARRTKSELQNECQDQCSKIPTRAFERIWSACISETGAVAYMKSGPRGAMNAPSQPK